MARRFAYHLFRGYGAHVASQRLASAVFDHLLTPAEERALYDRWHRDFGSPRFEVPRSRPAPGTAEFDVYGQVRTRPEP